MIDHIPFEFGLPIAAVLGLIALILEWINGEPE